MAPLLYRCVGRAADVDCATSSVGRGDGVRRSAVLRLPSVQGDPLYMLYEAVGLRTLGETDRVVLSDEELIPDVPFVGHRRPTTFVKTVQG